MKKGDFNTKKGFTIIEVSLVLAIAGLIFLMVFIALPALRSSQRDTERKEAVTLLIDAIKKYQSNNRGALPSTENDWLVLRNNYVRSDFTDPNGTPYEINHVECANSTDSICTHNGISDIYNAAFPNGYRMTVVTKASCDGQQAKATSNPRRIAILYVMERGGVYCASS